MAMDEVKVSRAHPGELEAAWAIVAEYYEAVGVVVREDQATFLRYYFADGAGVWLARLRGSVVGCIALRHLDHLPRAGEIKRLYVQPASRGLGVAGLLLAALHEYAEAAGCEWLYLDSKDDLKVAHAFYRQHGYQLCDRYNDNPQATVFMRRRLTGPVPSPARPPLATLRERSPE